MFGIGRLTEAVGSLTASVERLRDTVVQINVGLRGRLRLDPLPPPPEPTPEELEGPETRNGRIGKKGKSQ